MKSAMYQEAKKRYLDVGVDTDRALERLAGFSISLQCWQGDDVRGFLNPQTTLGGGLSVTGSCPGAARNATELRQDLDRALALIPGRHKVNLHAIYAETDGSVDLDALAPKHFSAWLDWASERKLGLDFNPTCFSHPLAADGFTLSHADPKIRAFWIDHCKASRRIGEAFGKRLGKKCVTNLWIPDGYKDLPADRLAPRARLASALDEVFKEALDPAFILDTLESKLFGIGSESYVVGSHEFYMGYALSRRKTLCLDTGHFHLTESVPDKLSALSLYFDELLIHVSRPVRWDSDHIPLFDDATRELALEIVRQGLEERVHIGLDYFDASVNRVAAWVIGARNTLKSLLYALLEPSALLRQYENDGDYTSRLALLEGVKAYPFSAIWDQYCEVSGVPTGEAWLAEAVKPRD